MSFEETVLLGALAGFTIYLSLPFGRLELLSQRARVGLAMFSVGVLAFLIVDVFEHAFEIVEEAVEGFKEDERSFADAAGLALLLAGGATNALTVEQAEAVMAESAFQRTRALRTGMTIAIAIGLHNFAEGLAI